MSLKQKSLIFAPASFTSSCKLQGIIVQFVSCYGFLCLVFLSLVQFCYSIAGTESEQSYAGRDSQRRLLRQSLTGNHRPLKIAAINGKHKGHRYLSKECKCI